MQEFIVVDDDPINNFICREYIKCTIKTPHHVMDFTSPQQALDHIALEYSNTEACYPTILFLDINMPSMSGWEFLEKFGQLDEHIQKLFSIYIVSSSINQRDNERAALNPHIKGFVVKPIEETFLLKCCA